MFYLNPKKNLFIEVNLSWGVGHFEVGQETRLGLRRIALWDCFGDAVASVFGYYNVAREKRSNNIH